jgi:hypothetical protein
MRPSDSLAHPAFVLRLVSGLPLNVPSSGAGAFLCGARLLARPAVRAPRDARRVGGLVCRVPPSGPVSPGAQGSPTFTGLSSSSSLRLRPRRSLFGLPYRLGGCCLQPGRGPQHPGSGDFGAALPRLARSPAYASTRPLPAKLQDWATGLLATLWPDGARTHRTTSPNFMPSSRDTPFGPAFRGRFRPRSPRDARVPSASAERSREGVEACPRWSGGVEAAH